MKKLFVIITCCLFASLAFADNFTDLKKQAEDGDAFAQYKVAKAYATGFGAPQNAAEALKWAKLSAEGGNGFGQNMLANIYLEQKNFQEALKWAKLSADGGNDYGKYTLATMYLGGLGSPEDKGKVVELLSQVADKGNVDAQNLLAQVYFYGLADTPLNWSKAFYLAGKAAAEPQSQGILATIYLYGIGAEKDIDKGLNFAKKAAANGDLLGVNALGVCYLNGYGVEKDEKKAFELFTKSQHLFAAENLAYMYARGLAAEKNLKKALEFYEMAGNAGLPRSQATLADAYLTGKLADSAIEKDYNKAFYWAQKASANKDARGDEILAEIYLFGLGAEKNPQKAFEFCKKAADKGNIEAISNLASMYLLGDGTEKNLKKALELHLKAAENGVVNSQKILALLYCGKYGGEVEKDFAKAQYWAEKAAANGDFDAKMLLIIIRNKDNPDKVKAEMEKLKETQGKTFTPKQINFIDNFIKNLENSAKK